MNKTICITASEARRRAGRKEREKRALEALDGFIHERIMFAAARGDHETTIRPEANDCYAEIIRELEALGYVAREVSKKGENNNWLFISWES